MDYKSLFIFLLFNVALAWETGFQEKDDGTDSQLYRAGGPQDGGGTETQSVPVNHHGNQLRFGSEKNQLRLGIGNFLSRPSFGSGALGYPSPNPFGSFLSTALAQAYGLPRTSRYHNHQLPPVYAPVDFHPPLIHGGYYSQPHPISSDAISLKEPVPVISQVPVISVPELLPEEPIYDSPLGSTSGPIDRIPRPTFASVLESSSVEQFYNSMLGDVREPHLPISNLPSATNSYGSHMMAYPYEQPRIIYPTRRDFSNIFGPFNAFASSALGHNKPWTMGVVGSGQGTSGYVTRPASSGSIVSQTPFFSFPVFGSTSPGMVSNFAESYVQSKPTKYPTAFTRCSHTRPWCPREVGLAPSFQDPTELGYLVRLVRALLVDHQHGTDEDPPADKQHSKEDGCTLRTGTLENGGEGTSEEMSDGRKKPVRRSMPFLRDQ